MTVTLYRLLIELLQEMVIWRDLFTLCVRGQHAPPVTCLRSPPAGTTLRRLAIFVIFADTLETNHLRAMEALTDAGYQIALVNNKPFRDPLDLPPSVAFVIESHNAGRDIGGYIRALRFIETCGALAHEARILFLNDSVIFLPGIRPVFERLAAAPEDWIGVTESHQGGHHVTSWCFQLSASITRHPAFRRWSASVAFVSNRVYLIRAGEVRLSHCLMAAGLRPRVLFGREFWAGLQRRIESSGSVVARIVPRHLAELYPRTRDENVLLREANQTHLFTFPGVVFQVFPFIKKDLYYREVFRNEHVELLCSEVSAVYGAAIGAECRSVLLGRGKGRALQGRARFRWRLGID